MSPEFLDDGDNFIFRQKLPAVRVECLPARRVLAFFRALTFGLGLGDPAVQAHRVRPVV